MLDLSTESLKGDLQELTRLFLCNQLYECHDHLDYVMKNYFLMKSDSNSEAEEKIVIQRNEIVNRVGDFFFNITPTNEPYKSVPMCSCRRYSKDDSGLVVILMISGTPKVIVPPFNRLYWHWLFYGDIWPKEKLMQYNEIKKSCAIEGIPKSTGTFYIPERVLSYLMENFERINTDQQKEIQKEQVSWEKL
jgi:hypothetical protein